MNKLNFTKSDEYRNKIHNLIPGGAHTYSKGDDQFPALAPAAIKKGKGIYVWDLDGNKFMDCSMALGSVTLGHAFDEVNNAVCEAIADGVNFQRPSYLELKVAEAFLGVVNYHDMIKFAKNGSTVTTAAVKLARAYTKRDLVAFPVDHPFYSYDDWFIGVKECNAGIPERERSSSITYQSNDIESLKALFAQYPNQIACIITEPEKFDAVNPTFLKEALELCHKNGALFIADEMVTGFKVDFPGSCKKHGIVPDLATWGKGIANGFAFCALTGKKEVMELGGIKKTGAEKVFLISSTHGGEVTGLAAVLKTIEIYKRDSVSKSNNEKGQYLINKIRNAIKARHMEKFVSCTDSTWTVGFAFAGLDGNASGVGRTYFMQEMIQRGVLFQGALVPTHSHTYEDLDLFVKIFDECLGLYEQGLKVNFEGLLVGEACKPVFRKYI